MMCNFCKGEKFPEMKILVTIFCFEMVFLFAGSDPLSCFINNSGYTNLVQPLLIVMLIVLCAQ